MRACRRWIVKNRSGILPGREADGMIGERYRIKHELGRGGMSVVWLAEDIYLKKERAVKEIRKTPSQTGGISREACFWAEVDMLRSLDHPALPGIIDVIETEEAVFLIMEYVQGESLHTLLQRLGRISEPVAADWMKQLADILQYLHSRKPPVIYRDMKPANVIRREDGSLSLIDLGIARAYKSGQYRDTVLFGTPGYAAPELLCGKQTDIRSDLYSLGVTAAEMLTGISPQEERFFRPEILTAELRKRCSAGMAEILKKCMAMSPEDRYKDCRELQKDLFRIRRRKGPRFIRGRRPAVLAGLLAVEICTGILTGGGRLPADAVSGQAEETRCSQLVRQLAEDRQQDGFSEKESSRFLSAWSGLSGSGQEEEGFSELCFTAGQTFLYCYTGANNSFRKRVLLARPFFAAGDTAAARLPEKDGGPPPEAGRLRNYRILCDFFADYMFSETGITEPENGGYGSLLRAVKGVLEENGVTDAADGAYVQLTLYQNMTELLQEFRQGIAAEGIPEAEMCGIVAQIRAKAEQTRTERASLEEQKQKVLRECTEAEERIRQTYRNIGRWKPERSEEAAENEIRQNEQKEEKKEEN